jgi:hypothetical protein
MAFVQFGAPGIRILQSGDEIRRRVLAELGAQQQPPLTCDAWNFYFTAATGISGPDADKGCYSGNRRKELVSVDHWLRWFEQQR